MEFDILREATYKECESNVDQSLQADFKLT